jgi:flagellar basal body rod protein FlgG
MTFDYTAMKLETVEPLINEFGKDGQLAVNVVTITSYLVDRDGNFILDREGNKIIVTEGTAPYDSQLDGEVLHPVRLVQTRFKKMDNNGTLVEVGDVLYLVSTQGVTVDPALANRIRVDSVTYQVVRVDPLVPGPVIMFWYIHARK